MEIHLKAIDWALAKGYRLSVTDYCIDLEGPDDFDLYRSSDRDAIIEAIEATELPNVHIIDPKYNHTLAIFSVIDEGIPEETINDYSPAQGEFNDWVNSQT